MPRGFCLVQRDAPNLTDATRTSRPLLLIQVASPKKMAEIFPILSACWTIMESINKIVDRLENTRDDARVLKVMTCSLTL
jgi:hypothetical protein